MRKSKALIVLCGSLMVLAVVQGQQKSTTNPTLTALDYAEIQQLYARYAHGIDSGAENGELFARVFTSDGIFEVVTVKDGLSTSRVTQGHAKLAEMANRIGKGPTFLHHWAVNIMIEPSPEGATGSAYNLVVEPLVGDPTKPYPVTSGGIYKDIFVKGPDGWRIKKRTYHYANTIPRTPAPTSATSLPR